MQECHGKVNIDFSGMKKIALVGNPSVGKSVIFSHLTGMYVTVSNYPGTTVEVSRGAGTIARHKYEVIDTPGMNNLIPSSEDKKVARDLLLNECPDLVIQVADAKNLRRTLLLTLQLKAMGFPIILNLNMMDEAEQRRIEINVKKLSELLDVVIVSTIATDGIGVWELKETIDQAAKVGGGHKLKLLSEHARENRERQRQVVEIYKAVRSEEHTSELQSHVNLVCRLLLEK